MSSTLHPRFWSKVRKTVSCWVWIGAKSKQGYGYIRLGGKHEKQLRAHRLSYEMHNSRIPKGMCVLHHCNNPACVNPKHLFLGTIADNSVDKVSKKRQPRGENHGMVRLSETAVQSIRKDRRKSLAQIATDYGTTPQTIWMVRTRKTWRHV